VTSDRRPASPSASSEPADQRYATVAAAPIDAQSCSIAGALAALGDAWSILVLRELFYGVRRFNDMQQDLGISRSVLANRLNRLVELGVARPQPYQEPGDRVRNQYTLTRKGVALLPTMVSLMEWGDRYINEGEPPVALLERGTDEPVRVELRSASGNIVQPNDIVPHVSRAYARAQRR
jgi:DNA-binding HxlR family transcriptional regulator